MTNPSSSSLLLRPNSRFKQALLLLAAAALAVGAASLFVFGPEPLLVALGVLLSLVLGFVAHSRRLLGDLNRRQRLLERRAEKEPSARQELRELQQAIVAALADPSPGEPTKVLVPELPGLLAEHHEQLQRDLHRDSEKVTERMLRELRAMERRAAFASVDAHRQIEAVLSLRALLPEARPLPPTRGWAASPDLLLELVQWILNHKPTTVVECGSGTSSVYIALALAANGHGRLVALEHEEKFAARTRSAIDAQGLQEFVEVRTGPLIEVELDGRVFTWYDPDLLTNTSQVDLVLVDGPPAASGSRYPALPILRDRMTSAAAVFLDDASRDEEQRVVEAWARDNPDFTVELLDHEKGTAVFRREP